MKTTSFLISKQLKEAGFEAEFNFHYKATDHCNLYDSGYEDYKDRNTPAYDLETILDALPDSITREYKSKEDGEVKEFREKLIIEKNEIRYSCDDIENADDANRYFQEYGYMQDISVFKKFDAKSLADTAGRMWLELKEKNLL